MTWRRVVSIGQPHKSGRVELRLACGHRRLLDPVLPLETIRQGLLASTVPCPLCGRPEAGLMPEPIPLRRTRAGLLEAAQETKRQARVERAWNLDIERQETIVRPSLRYL